MRLIPTQRVRFIMTMWSMTFCLCFISCDLDYEDDQCCYNTIITYRYYHLGVSESLMASENDIGYIRIMTHLVYRNDTLVGRIDIDPSGNRILGEIAQNNYENSQSVRQLKLNLPQGAYTIDTWGNLTETASDITAWDNKQITRSEIMLQHAKKNNDMAITPSLSYSDPLFHGSTQIKVEKCSGVNTYVDMLAAHAKLSFTIRWGKNSAPPLATDKIMVYLENLPSKYYSEHSHIIELETPGKPLFGGHDIRLKVPKSDESTVRVGTTPSLFFSEIKGSFMSLRYRGDTHPTLRLFGGRDGTTPLMLKRDGTEMNLDLKRLFDLIGLNMDNHLWQYFEIDILIDGSTVTVSEISLGVEDWMDGGDMW